MLYTLKMSIHPKHEDKQRTARYVANKFTENGETKREQMLNAGYSEVITRVPNKVETTLNYKQITSQLLGDSFGLVSAIVRSLNGDHEEIAKLPAKERAEILLKITSAMKNIMPEIKVKTTEFDPETGLRKSVWTTTPQ